MMYNFKDLTTFQEMLTSYGTVILDYKLDFDIMPSIGENENLYCVDVTIYFGGEAYNDYTPHENTYSFYTENCYEMNECFLLLDGLVKSCKEYREKEEMKFKKECKEFWDEILN